MKKKCFVFIAKRNSIYFLFLLLVNCTDAFCQTSVTFNYTGATQTWTVPNCANTITVTAEGAQGGGATGGLGAVVTATLAVTPGQVLEVNVGGQGASAGVGWNGGGAGWTGSASSFGGGGASDIRIAPYALGNRLIVAAGGGGDGGGSPTVGTGGAGDCNTGATGTGSPFQTTGGSGGSQTAGGIGGPPWSGGGFWGLNGSLGQGGDGGFDPTFGASGGGGGGGYYGGGGGGSDGCCSGSNGGAGGGGGSSFVPVGGSCTGGTNTGNGVVTILYVPGLSSSVTSTNPLCNGGTGSATATIIGGTPAFTYLWSPSGGNSSAATGLSAGNYTVTITDANGCTSTNTVTITVPAALTLSVVSTTTVNCGATNGSATVSGNGGTGALTYTWNTAPVQNGPTANNLAAGSYTCTLTDANGCTVTQLVTITGSGSYTVTPASTNVNCFGNNNGSATVTTSGGTSPFTYAWSTTPVQTTSTLSNIPAGNYTCVITDASGCTQTATFTITQPVQLTSSITNSTNASCFGLNNGTATASGTGGTGPLNYSWNTTPAQAGPTANNLSAGSYVVTVTDANNCTSTSSVTITEPPAMTLTTGSTPSACGVNDGTVTANSSGGVAPHTYLWLTTPVQTTPVVSGLGAGVYTIIVTDANGCTQSQNVTVGGGAPPVADFSLNPADLVNLLDPMVSFTDLSSGNPTIWNWDFGDSLSGNNVSTSQNPTHAYSDTGFYCITLIISDQSGSCIDTAIKCLRVESPFTFYVPNSFTPNSDGFNEYFTAFGSFIKEFDMKIFDRWGNTIFSCHTMGEPNLDPKCAWDAKVRKDGQTVQEDVYVWRVDLVDFLDKKHQYIGNVSVIR